MNQPRLTIDQYSHNKNLFEAWTDAFSLVNNDDWICFKDGDACWLEMSDFGHVLGEYITKYPNTGLFTCYASRCHYAWQVYPGLDQDEKDVKYWAKCTVFIRDKHHLEVVDIKPKIAGHLAMLKKSTWLAIQPMLLERLKKYPKHILGFDNWMSRSIIDCGYDIKLMKGMLLFHYLRLLTGKNDLLL